MDADRLAEIRARCDAATEGPWWSHELDGTADVYGPTGAGVAYDRDGGCASSEDATFIAHARTDVPELVAAVEALTEERDRYRHEAQTREHHFDMQNVRNRREVYAAEAQVSEQAQVIEGLRAEADDLYHRWGRQVRYLVGILSRWEQTESALCMGMTGGEPVVEPGSLIADTREAIAMARGDLDPERAHAALASLPPKETTPDE